MNISTLASFASAACCWLALWLTSSIANAEDDEIIFSLRKWSGEYESRDIPGGVQTTPSTASIFSVGADGSNLKQVVAINGAVCAAPNYSPDGEWIYFQSNASGSYHLYRCKSDGSAREQLTTAERPGPPWTSVFGLQVATSGDLLCTVNKGDSGCVALFSPTERRMHLVAPHLGYLYMSAISKKGDAVICSGPASGYRLWLFLLPEAFAEGDSRVDGPAVDLAPNHPQSFSPQFTPDGQTIIYFRRDGDIYRVDRDGSNQRRLTEGNAYVEFRLSPSDRHGSTDGPHLSPNGQQIAYIAMRDGTPNVCTINLDGSNQRQLTFRDSPCGRVRWSPDGHRIAFVSFVGRYPQLFMISTEGGPPRQVTTLDGAVNFMQWKPRRK